MAWPARSIPLCQRCIQLSRCLVDYNVIHDIFCLILASWETPWRRKESGREEGGGMFKYYSPGGPPPSQLGIRRLTNRWLIDGSHIQRNVAKAASLNQTSYIFEGGRRWQQHNITDNQTVGSTYESYGRGRHSLNEGMDERVDE